MRWFALTSFAVGLVMAAAGTAAADHLTKCPGTWEMVSGERDGKALPKEDVEHVTMTCKAEGKDLKIVVKKHDKVVTEATAKLAKEGKDHDQYDITYAKGTSPKGEDLKGKTVHGIISVAGDTMKVCWHGGEGYPKEFTGAKDSHCALRTYKRVK
ncbi:MAG: TIGR03067 domain-containing protein [Planctomycetia bacterium]|nr:TIGR03067 domain-containing protein [Planctomycetia bacterium]